MANWNLAEKQIYKLLKHPFQKEKSDIESITAAYLEFVEELFDYLNKENDNKTRIRQLNMSYIDFGTIKALEETSPFWKGCFNNLYICFSAKFQFAIINLSSYRDHFISSL